MSIFWLIIAAAYALLALAALVSGQNASEEVMQMLLALALMKLYDMDGENE